MITASSKLEDSQYYGARMTATFFDRRFRVLRGNGMKAVKAEGIRDNEGNVIIETQDSRGNCGPHHDDGCPP